MPELPEVETTVRRFRARLVGRRVADFASRWPPQLLPDPTTVTAGVLGRRFMTLERRAKWVVAALDDGAHLLVHLRMSGSFGWLAPEDAEPPYIRAVWTFTDGYRLALRDPRKFGRIRYTRDLVAATAALGPEPLARTFTAAGLGRRLAGRRRLLKPLLLDQGFLAGLGNIYADESLYAARLHPARRADTLAPEDVRRLHRAVRRVLREAIRHNGTSFDAVYPSGGMEAYLQVYGKRGQPCPACGTPIVYAQLAQRGTHFCPVCQPAP